MLTDQQKIDAYDQLETLIHKHVLGISIAWAGDERPFRVITNGPRAVSAGQHLANAVAGVYSLVTR